VFFSIDHAEYVPYYANSANGVAGAHQTVQVKYSGTGLATNINTSAYFGSAGHLLGINMLDTANRGVFDTICTHELLHQWVSYTSGSLGLTSSDGSHYLSACSANSLVGGTRWTPTTNAAFLTDCVDSDHAPPLDKYMMGFYPGSSVPPLYIATNGAGCYSFVTNYRTVTISDIQAMHGVRTPTPANAQKNFALCFIAESFGRLLTTTELTFYDTLANHYTKPIPPGQPAPLLGGAWVSIDRYFGEASTWRSDVLNISRPGNVVAERTTNGTARISGTGYPGRNYRLLRSTNSQPGPP